MTELVAPQNTQEPWKDPRWAADGGNLALGYGGAASAPGPGWASSPYLQSSDLMVRRSKDLLAADARDASRANPYGKSALRSSVDAVIGANFALSLSPDAAALGVLPDEAAEWADMVEAVWRQEAESPLCHFDAQRKQTFSGLMRTAYSSLYVSGEMLGTNEWKRSLCGTRTCLNLIDPERLSDPRYMPLWNSNRRMGVERDKFGEPIAYHIREKHPSDAYFNTVDDYRWKRVPRYTSWGRQLVIHYFEQDRPDMTRGMSSFTTALLPMRLLQDYMTTELESAAIRATYAAVIESELDYEKAMEVIGEQYSSVVKANPILDFTVKTMADRATFYRGQDVRFGKSKVAHLLPNENLKMVQGTQSASAVKDFSEQNLYTIASGLGVDFATLTKNYSRTNYSGARAALFDVWRSYEVRRAGFIGGVPGPFVYAWLEEKIALMQQIPMLGSANFYEVRDAICKHTFETWSKPRLDPAKENMADKVFLQMGVLSPQDICRGEGRDYRAVIDDFARYKAYMKKKGLTPEDVDWALIMNQGKGGQGDAAIAGGSSGESGGTGTNS